MKVADDTSESNSECEWVNYWTEPGISDLPIVHLTPQPEQRAPRPTHLGVQINQYNTIQHNATQLLLSAPAD